MPALFVALGGSAYAATQLKKNSVGTKQIKSNAVTKAKIKAGAVNSEKVADGSLTGTDINAPSTPFSQITQRLRTNVTANFEAEPFYQLGSYTRPPAEVDQAVPSLTVNFAASCEPPREAEAYLLVEPPNKLGEISTENLASVGLIIDKGTGAATRTMEFGPYPGPGTATLIKPAPAALRPNGALPQRCWPVPATAAPVSRSPAAPLTSSAPSRPTGTRRSSGRRVPVFGAKEQRWAS